MDFTYLAAQTFGDKELERELLQLFVKQARQIVDALPSREAREQEDAAHLLKGSARAVGATPVAEAADAYERADAAVRGPDAPLFRNLTASLQSAEMAIAAHLTTLR